MKNIFRLFAIIAIVAIIGFLAACSNGDDGTITPKPDDGTKPSGSKTPITVAEISITAPVNGGTPATTVDSVAERFTAGTVTWSPNDNPFQPNTEYTATVTLTAESGFTFTGINADQPKVNGTKASVLSNTGETVTLSHKFPATGTKIVSSIAIKYQPNNMSYAHGDKLDLSGMVVTLTYDDGSSIDVAHGDFVNNGITADPSQDAHLEHSKYDGKQITITYGNLTQKTTGTLTVTAIPVSVLTIDPIPEHTFTGSPFTPSVTVKHTVEGSTRTLQKDTEYTVAYSNNVNVGTATVTITGKGDYTGSRDVTFIINAAIPQGGAPQITTTALPHGTGDRAYSQTLTATGDTPITWSIEGTLPDGLSLNGTTGIISGTPFNRTGIWFEDTYRYTFTVKATNSAGSAEKQLSIIIARTYTDTSSLLSNIRTYAANTADTPYLVALKVTNMPRFYNSSLDGKFVSLDLSESTFNSNTIPNNGFYQCTNIVNIILPNSVISIGNQAFASCTNLTSIDIPNSVTSIGNNVFLFCSSLTAINVDAGNNAYSSQDGVLYNKAKTVLVEYPEGKTDLTFTIPDSVTTLLKGYLGSNTRLTAINVNAGNSAYSSQDGVLYDKAKTTLIEYPMGKTDNSFIIPNGVTNIDEGAIYNIGSLISVTIPNSVTSIGNNAFYSCTSLTSVTFAIGSNILNANFGDSAFPEGSTGGEGGNTLKTAYNAASPKEGTYTRAANGSTWSKQ